MRAGGRLRVKLPYVAYRRSVQSLVVGAYLVAGHITFFVDGCVKVGGGSGKDYHLAVFCDFIAEVAQNARLVGPIYAVAVALKHAVWCKQLCYLTVISARGKSLQYGFVEVAYHIVGVFKHAVFAYLDYMSYLVRDAPAESAMVAAGKFCIRVAARRAQSSAGGRNFNRRRNMS